MISSTRRNEVTEIAEQAYGIGTVSDVSVLVGGLTNTSYVVMNVSGGRFVVQELHPMFRRELMDDIIGIAGFLRENGWECLQLLETGEGNHYFEKDGRLWRAYPYVPAGNTPEKANYRLWEGIGSLLGRLHDNLSRCTYEPKHVLKGFHNKEYYLGKAMFYERKSYPSVLRAIFDDVTVQLEEYSAVLEGGSQLIHADPRIENILFSENEVPFVFIDYDTFMIASRYIDIGDCLRSLCQTTNNGSDLKKLVGSFLSGYNSMVGEDSRADAVRVIGAMKYITLELCLRFMVDSVEETYFYWDPAKFGSAAEHNAARAFDLWNTYNLLSERL